jgi:AraC-like DNA-binding protein
MSVAHYSATLPAPARLDDDGGLTAWDVAAFGHDLDHTEVFAEHQHPQHELIWFDRGAGTIETELGTWALTSGTAVWIPGFVPHAMVAKAGSRFSAMHFSSGLGLDDERWAVPHPFRVDQLTAALILRLESDPVDGRHRADLTRVLATMLGESEFADVLRVPRGPRTRRVAEAVLAEPSRTHGLDDWAELLGVSTRTLSRDFVTETGTTYSQWLTRARIQAALTQLRRRAPVEEVAEAVGYRTTSGFISVFRKHIGMTPGQYARRYGVTR